VTNTHLGREEMKKGALISRVLNREEENEGGKQTFRGDLEFRSGSTPQIQTKGGQDKGNLRKREKTGFHAEAPAQKREINC